MDYSLLYATLLIASLNWVAVSKKWKTLEYITKPGTMLALLGWIWSAQPHGFQGRLQWFGAALAFSLAGDIFLMLPTDRFIAGLTSFLFAHLAYIRGLEAWDTPSTIPTYLVLLLVMITSFQIYRGIARGLKRAGRENFKIPVLVYTVVISAMVFSALMTLINHGYGTFPALLISAGALLFFVSDTWIAWDRFVTPLEHRDLRVMVSYHLGQISLIVGAVIMF